MLYALIAIGFLALVFLPTLRVRAIMARHNKPRPDLPGTGGELARHLLDQAGLNTVAVEVTKLGDHYDPEDKVVRLTRDRFEGRSVTAVAVAAHEVGHALQDAAGYQPLKTRTRMAKSAGKMQRFASAVLIAAPVIALLTKSPLLIVAQVIAGLGIMATTVIMHAFTLPVELDASYRRALPLLKAGNYLPETDMPAARSVLAAAAFTYISAALLSLVDVARWFRVLRS